MITSIGKVLQYHGKKFCATCKQIRNHTCFWMKYRNPETNDDAYGKEERWNCGTYRTDKLIAKEIPIPTEQMVLVKLLMSLSEKYELKGTAISVGHREARRPQWPAWTQTKRARIAEKNSLTDSSRPTLEPPMYGRKGKGARNSS